MDHTEQIHDWIEQDRQYLKMLFPQYDPRVDYMTTTITFSVWINLFKDNKCIEFGHGQTLKEAIANLQKKLTDSNIIFEQSARQLGGKI